jgi:flagellar biogenesis protein FliO
MAVKDLKAALFLSLMGITAFLLIAVPQTVQADQSLDAASVQIPDGLSDAKSKTPFQKRLEDKKRKTEKALNVGSDVPKSTEMAERFVKGLIYCIVVFVVLSYLNNYLRSKKESSSANAIDLISRRAIGNRMSLLLVEVEGKKFFLSQTNDMVQMLAPLSDPLGLSEGFTDDTDCISQNSSEDYDIRRAVHE